MKKYSEAWLQHEMKEYDSQFIPAPYFLWIMLIILSFFLGLFAYIFIDQYVKSIYPC